MNLFGAQESQERDALAESTYAALKKLGKLRDHRILTYRCPRRCLLADVLQLPQGVIVHTPGYDTSPALNASTSTASGRAVNTLDGDHKWKAWTFNTADARNISLNCDHVHDQVLELDQVEADRAAGHTEVTVFLPGEHHPR